MVFMCYPFLVVVSTFGFKITIFSVTLCAETLANRECRFKLWFWDHHFEAVRLSL